MKSFKACLLGATTLAVMAVTAAPVSAQDAKGANYYLADGSQTNDYQAALASWRNDGAFRVDYSKRFLGLEHAYARGLSGQGQVIGLNDAGVHLDHPLLNAPGKVIGYDSGVSENFGNLGQVNPRRPWEGHGTHVAGTLAASRTATTPMFGNAYNATLLSATANFVAGDFRWYERGDQTVLPNTSFDNVIGMAKTGQVRIINNSWGAINFLPYDAPRETVIRQLGSDPADMWEPIKANDVLLVWSAGNRSGGHAGYTTIAPLIDPSLRDHWLSVVNYQSPSAADPTSSLCGQTATWCVAGPGSQIISGANSFSFDARAVESRFGAVEDYASLWRASSHGAMNIAAQDLLLERLSSFIAARNRALASNLDFDEVQWANIIAKTAAETALIYGARTGDPDANVAMLAGMVSAYRELLGDTFANAFFVQADHKLQDLYGEYLRLEGATTAAYTGTSMAAPNISGFAALLMEQFPEYETGLISDILVSSAQDIGTPGVDLVSGWGAPQMGTALEGPTALRDIRTVNVLTGTRDVWTNSISDARDRYDADVLQHHGDDIGGLIKVGGGELVLSGDVAYTGETQVLGGLLSVNGRILTSPLSVAQTGIIGGIGTLADLLADQGGIVAPGQGVDRFGTLTVAGDAVFKRGSYLWVNTDVNGAQYSQLNVLGRVTLEGGHVILKADNGLWNLRTDGLRIVTAQGEGAEGAAVVGRFDDLTTDLAFLDGHLTYQDGAVLLSLVRNDVSFGEVSEKANDKALGVALDQMVLDNAHGNMSLENALLDGSFENISQALGTLNGEVHASLGGAMVQDSRSIRSALQERGLGQTGRVQPLGNKGMQTWASVYGGQGDYAGTADVASFETRSSGFVAGFEKVGPGAHLGVAVGQSNKALQQHAYSEMAEASSRNLALYGGFGGAGFSLRAGAAWTQSDVETRRTAQVNAFKEQLVGDYQGETFQAYGEVAWSVDFDRAKLSPYASLTHIRYEADFAESGGDAALSGQVSQEAQLLSLGVRAQAILSQGSAAAPKIKLSAHAGWSHNLNDEGVAMTAAFADGPQFNVMGANMSETAVLLDLSLDAELSERVSVGVGYSGSFDADYSDSRLMGRLSYRF